MGLSWTFSPISMPRGRAEIPYNKGMKKNFDLVIWIARGLVGLVAFSNLLAAIPFFISPELFVFSFELSGDVGNAVIRGFGLLFLMWTIPYLVAVIHPLRHFTSLVEAVLMQAIGVAGESLILVFLPGGHAVLQSSVMRFIYFDGGGLVLLLIAFGLMVREKKKQTFRDEKNW